MHFDNRTRQSSTARHMSHIGNTRKSTMTQYCVIVLRRVTRYPTYSCQIAVYREGLHQSRFDTDPLQIGNRRKSVACQSNLIFAMECSRRRVVDRNRNSSPPIANQPSSPICTCVTSLTTMPLQHRFVGSSCARCQAVRRTRQRKGDMCWLTSHSRVAPEQVQHGS